MTSQPRPQPNPQANGAAAFHPDAATLVGTAVARQLAGMLQQVLPAAVHSAVAQALPQTRMRQPICASCLVRRLQWDARHRADMQAAQMEADFQTQVAAETTRKMKAEAGEPFDPAAVEPLNPALFLPEDLQPHPQLPWEADRMPALLDAVTQVGGTWVCAFDIPGAPQPDGTMPQPGTGRPIIAAPGISVSAAVAMVNDPANRMPGVPGQ